MNIVDLEIPGVKLIQPDYYADDRGYYCETYSYRTMERFGITNMFVQDNHFLSKRAGTIRGIHYQKDPSAQAKLIRCTRGKLMSVAVDLRESSPTYKKWASAILSEENRMQLFIPKGFGHCCMSLKDMTEGQYKVDAFYAPETEGAVRYDDPDIGIVWPDILPVVSAKDRNAPFLRECGTIFR